MSGGNQQKAIVAREIDKNPELLVAVQPTRGLDVGAIEYIHKQLVAQRDEGKAVLLVSLELDEVMNVSDRILVMYEGEIVGEFDPKKTTVEELGLYMAGAKSNIRKKGANTKLKRRTAPRCSEEIGWRPLALPSSLLLLASFSASCSSSY
jgi:simple sugar transport system ATP-binding protein